MIAVRIGPRLVTTATVVSPQNGVEAIQHPVAKGPAKAAESSIIHETLRFIVRLYSAIPLPFAVLYRKVKIPAKMSHIPINVIEQMILMMTLSLSAAETVVVTELLKIFCRIAVTGISNAIFIPLSAIWIFL